ncbi:hypothetical protein JCM11641_006632 [Rhodosporidiobolus odoratus]
MPKVMPPYAAFMLYRTLDEMRTARSTCGMKTRSGNASAKENCAKNWDRQRNGKHTSSALERSLVVDAFSVCTYAAHFPSTSSLGNRSPNSLSSTSRTAPTLNSTHLVSTVSSPIPSSLAGVVRVYLALATPSSSTTPTLYCKVSLPPSSVNTVATKKFRNVDRR